jgi:hypothetical protein
MKRPSTWYSGTRPGVGSLSGTGLSPSLAGLSRPLSLANRFVTPCGNRSSRWTALQHRDCNGCDLSRSHGLGSSAFARHYSRNVLCSSRYLDVSVPSVSSPRSMYSTVRPWTLLQGGFPIRISSDQRLLATPRSISLPATSFVGSWRQGIHRMLLVA